MARSKLIVVLALAVALLVSPATLAQPAPPARTVPHGIHRTRLDVGGETLVWSRSHIGRDVAQGKVGSFFGLTDPGGAPLLDAAGKPARLLYRDVLPEATGVDRKRLTQLVLAYTDSATGKRAEVPPGPWHLWSYLTPVTAYVATLAVEDPAARPDRPWVTLAALPGDNTAQLRAVLASGGNPDLLPGTYAIADLPLPPGGRIRGSGDATRLVGVRLAPVYAERMMRPTKDNLVENLSIEHPGQTAYVFHSGPGAAGNLTVRRVTFRGALHFGESYGLGLLVEDCLFDRASLMQVSSQTLVRRCRFDGSRHPLSTWGGDSIAILECDFRGTDRGIIVQGSRGPVTNMLTARLSFSDIWMTDNGGEVLCFEGATVRHSMFLHTRIAATAAGCGIQFYDGVYKDNLFSDVLALGGTGIWFYQAPGTSPSQTRNVFEHIELWGGRVRFGRAAGNVIKDIAVMRPTGQRGNQFWNDTAAGSDSWYAAGRPVFSAEPGTGNVVEWARVVEPGACVASDGNVVFKSLKVIRGAGAP